MRKKFIHCTDAYKFGHAKQYPVGEGIIFLNDTARWSRIPGQESVVKFGTQYLCQDIYTTLANETFFGVPKGQVMDDYIRRCVSHFGPGAVDPNYVADLHDLGYLPIDVRARQEGELVRIGTPSMTIEGTHEHFKWVPNWLETISSDTMWMPSCNATIAYRYRQMFNWYAEHQGAPLEGVQFQGHDFSMRGISSLESAIVSGAAHLLSFVGTDTVPAVDFIEEFYGEGLLPDYLIGCSVPATEHSVMCAGGETDELGTFYRILTDVYPSGIVSIVSDTWDFWGVIDNHLPALKEVIMGRDGKCVIRPDSGDPVKILCGDDSAPVGSSAYKGLIESLWDLFGGTTTAKGYKILDSHIGAIYGDAITEQRAKEICMLLQNKGLASINVVFGIGSFTYQYVTRDTFSDAWKATNAIINGVETKLKKTPKTDSKKDSATGYMVINQDGSMTDGLTKAEYDVTPSLLVPIWRDGQFVQRTNFKEIRERLWPVAA